MMSSFVSKKLLATVLSLSLGVAMAQEYPSKPIRMVAPFAPGGGSDVVARIVAQKLSIVLKRSVVVDNRPGASGIIGADIAAKSAPDGYTVLVTNSSLASNPGLYKKLPFNAEKDFVAVAELASTPLVLAAHPNAPFNNLREMVEYARKNPLAVTVGTAGAGQMGHLAAELLGQTAGIKMQMVHYKGGSSAMQDLLSGTVMTSLVTAPTIMNQVAGGKLKAIAVTGSGRIAALPNVAAMAETYGGLDAVTWFGVFVPAGTPAHIVEKLAGGTDKVLADPAVRAKLEDEGMDVGVLSGSAFDRKFRADMAKWKKFVAERGIRLDS